HYRRIPYARRVIPVAPEIPCEYRYPRRPGSFGVRAERAILKQEGCHALSLPFIPRSFSFHSSSLVAGYLAWPVVLGRVVARPLVASRTLTEASIFTESGSGLAADIRGTRDSFHDQ